MNTPWWAYLIWGGFAVWLIRWLMRGSGDNGGGAP